MYERERPSKITEESTGVKRTQGGLSKKFSNKGDSRSVVSNKINDQLMDTAADNVVETVENPWNCEETTVGKKEREVSLHRSIAAGTLDAFGTVEAAAPAVGSTEDG